MAGINVSLGVISESSKIYSTKIDDLTKNVVELQTKTNRLDSHISKLYTWLLGIGASVISSGIYFVFLKK